MLTKDGFKRKTYEDLLADTSLKAQEMYGENINLSPRSPMGIILRLFAYFLAAVWMLAEKVYYSAFVSKAEGVQLDYLGANRGVPREKATESYVDLSFVGTPGLTVPNSKQYTTETDVYFILTEDVLLDEAGIGTGRAVSVEAGIHTLVPANSITIQAEPIEGLTSVNNPTASAGGRDRESDAEYRLRLPSTAGGKGTPSAIESALRSTSGVRSANVVINNKNVVDADGNDPKSIHAYVLGGDPQTIGEALWDSVGGGIDTIGAQAIMVEDLSGIEHEVRFDFATDVNVQIQVTLSKNSSFPTDGLQQVEDKLVQTIGGIDSKGTYWSGYSMGQDVIYSQLFGKIYSIPGIEDIALSIGVEGDVLGATNIAIGPDQVANTAAALIEVA